MKLKFSLRIKIFLIAVLVVVSGQIIYSKKNVDYFQATYLETLREKSQTLGTFLKNDVEYILNLNIPITKLIKLENTLNDILQAFPELRYIEITDLDGFQLYYADHESIRRVEPGLRKSAGLETNAIKELDQAGVTIGDVDVVLPVYHLKKQVHVGNITLRLSPNSFTAQSRQILWDMITVILTSLLITFEFLSFFVSFSIADPLERISQDFKRSIYKRSYMSGQSLYFINGLGIVIELFNQRMGQLLNRIRPVNYARHIFPGVAQTISVQITDQVNAIKDFLRESSSIASEAVKKNCEKSLLQVSYSLIELQKKMDQFSTTLMKPLWLVEYVNRRKKNRKKPTIHIPYAHIRPMIFLFVMADGFCASFFPIYVETVYQPLWGLSKEVVLGLPISAFMLFFALSMPLTGYWSDRVGWFRPLIAGIALNAIGLLMTALSENMFHLLAARSVTAVGFGMVYMGCQRFIFDNTSKTNRSLGMASFLAAFFGGDICGTVMGGMLADRIGYSQVFTVSSVVAFFALLCCWFIFKNDPRMPDVPKKATSAKSRFLLKDAFRVLKDPEFCATVFLQAIPAKITLIGFLYYFIPLYLRKLGTLQSDIGRVIMCYGIALVFLGPFFSKYFDKINLRKYYIAAGGLLTGISMTCFFFFSGFVPAFGLVILLGIAHTMSTSSQTTIISETLVIKEMGAGAGLGLFRFWERLGNISGPLLMGFLMAKWGYEHAVAILGIISIVCSLLYMVFILGYRNKTRPESADAIYKNSLTSE
ncbi:MAG: MFS transporter [Desulfobacula sp.]|nr:MFS transporter [Desulfobacula sp.]